MEDLYYPSDDGESQIHAVIWRPEQKPVGIVQIIHGMCEYAARYAPFAQFLCGKGYVVCAEDHLGHGLSAAEGKLGFFGRDRDYNTVLADIKKLNEIITGGYDGLPCFVMGHSMGSFFCRNYIARYGSGLSGAIIMGTGYKGGALMGFAKFVTRLNALFFGWEHRSKFLTGLALGPYDKPFKNEGVKNAWLSADRENIQTYNADPLCGFTFTDNGYYVLFSVIKAACSGKTVKSVPVELPVLFVSGEGDPVGDFGKGVIKARNKFVKAGVKDVSLKLYKNSRHEILNDVENEDVRADIAEFLSKNATRA